MSLRRRPSAAWIAPLFCACGGGGAFDFELVPDPNLATDEQLAEQLGTLVFVFDSPEGLYEPGEEQSEETFQIKDADANPDDLELVVTIPVTERALPTLRIERGGLPDAPLDVRVLGLPLSGDTTPIAQGTLRGLRFTDDTQPIAVPFDLRDDVLPPRVEDVLPADGSDLPGCRVTSIVLVFSRPVDKDSLASPDAVRIEPGIEVTSISVDDAGLVATLVPSALESDADSLSYRVVVGESVVDLDGQPFDQIPRDKGAQPFDAEFHHACVPPPTMPVMPCGGVECPDSERIACVEQLCTFTSCTDACDGGSVCDPVHDRCVEDCRNGDAVSGCLKGSSCDGETGLCVSD